jgi:ribonuclease D
MAAVRALWETRDAIASQRDISPGRIIPDTAIVAAANALPQDRTALLALKGFHGRGAERYATQWVKALREVRSLPDHELPPLATRYDGPPPPRSWPERDPVAATRLSVARTELATLAAKLNLPVENLLTPDFVRRLMWDPPRVTAAETRIAPEDAFAEAVAQRLRELGAREWQVELTAGLLARAVTAGAEQADDS